MKIALSSFPQLFARKKKKTLRLSTARRAAAAPELEELGEPNMKLSRALLIVLLLHVVAVGGIIAFNAIKSREQLVPAPAVQARPVASPPPAATATPTPASTRPAVLKPERKPAFENTRTYTVAKGDTPVTIARRFKVPFDDLVAANHIDDPRKLKIGQKLVIPAKTAKAKKGNE